MGRRLLSLALPSAVLAGVLSIMSSSANAAGINDYSLTRTFTLPTPSIAFSNVLFDALPDGRLVALNGTTLLRETGVKTGTFATVGTVGNFSTSYGASFLTVSPDGTQAAVGSNGGGTVTVFSTATPANGTAYAADDSDAAWLDNGRLAISNSQGVQVLNTGTGAVKTVINNIGGFSGGVAVDAAGNLYTGNGSSTSAASGTGLIKAFSGSAITAASATGASAIDFQASGSAIADLLSAGSLGFDNSGNFFVGGGDFFGTSGDTGYAGLVSASAVQTALAAGSLTPTIDANSAAAVLRKFTSPSETIAAFQAPGWGYNEATGELYLRYAFGDGTVNVYSVPEPAMLSMIGLAAIGALRRRRCAIAATIAVLPASAVLAGPYSPGKGGAAESGYADAGIPSYVGPAGDGVIGTTTNGNTVNPLFKGWATGTTNYLPSDTIGTYAVGGVGSQFADPSAAIGTPTGTGIVSLGDRGSAEIAAGAAPGSLTLTFAKGIRNGPAADFAAFENGFVSGYSTGDGSTAGQMFAELGFVEVSTDGTNFARFPSQYLNYPNASMTGKVDNKIDLNGTGTPISTAYLTQDVSNVYNLVGKHQNSAAGSFGTPFNLDDLSTNALVQAGLVDLQNIQYVRIVDIAGDGSMTDSSGRPIFDAWVTWGSGGVDFDALGVINEVPEPSTLAVLALTTTAPVRRRRQA
ncbi:MAG: PEP-CTERM sorting domain-containing protein [Tepidisphaeraceae bacterium]